MDGSRLSPVLRDRSRHAAPQVVDVLREEILGLVLVPGTALSRAELQDRCRVSSTPVRDALLRLQEEGLADVFPQHATLVSLIDLESARQTQFLRRSIESEIARVLAVEADPVLGEHLRTLVDEQRWLTGRRDFDRFASIDLEFHKTIYDAARVPELWAIVRRQSGHIDLLRRLHLPVAGKASQVVDEHAAIVDAIAAKRPAEAQDRVRDHLSKSIAFGTAIRDRHPAYFR
jgi:DNA-binding GntR family transcriptional regulator